MVNSGGDVVAKKRVAVPSSGTIFMKAVTNMLKWYTDLLLSRIFTDDVHLLDRLAAIDPDVVIVEREDVSLNSRYPLWSLLEGRPNTTVVTVTMMESRVHLYNHRWVEGANEADLLALITGADGGRRNTPGSEVTA